MAKMFRALLFASMFCGAMAYSQSAWRSIGPNVGNIVRLEVNSNGHVFAGSTINAGLNRTTDGGISWKKISGNCRFFAAGGNHLFDAPANGALRYSGDFGETWVTRSSPSSSIVQLCFTTGSLYLATYDGLYRSTDLGVSFVLLRSHVHTPGSFQFGIAQGPNGTIFTSGNYNYPSYEGAYYRSTDGGQTWIRMPWFGVDPHWAFNSTGQVFIAAGLGVWKSGNDGDSWVQVSAESNVKSIGIDSDDRVFITTDASAFRSTDNGATWTQVTTGMDRAGGGKLLCITPSGNLYSGSSSGPLYSSTDSGDSWVESGLPIAIINAISIAPGGKFFAACGFNLAFCSTNAGSVWNRTGFDYPDCRAFLIADTIISALRALEIDRSPDNGVTWRRTFRGAFPDFLYSGMVSGQPKAFYDPMIEGIRGRGQFRPRPFTLLRRVSTGQSLQEGNRIFSNRQTMGTHGFPSGRRQLESLRQPGLAHWLLELHPALNALQMAV